MKTQSRFVIGSMAILIVGLVALSLLIAGSSLAQGSAGPGVKPVLESIIKDDAPQGWDPFPFEAGLRELVDQGLLTQDEMDQIMADLAQRSEGVTVEKSQDGQGAELVEIIINDDGSVGLWGPMTEALDAAVTKGLISEQEAAAVLERVHAAR